MIRKIWIILVGIFVLINTVGCTTEAEYLNLKDSVNEYLGDKYPDIDFELIQYYRIPKAQPEHQFSFQDSSERQFYVMINESDIHDNYLENLLKEEVSEIITELVNESKYNIEKIHVGGVSYKFFEGLSVYDCSEVVLDLMISGKKMPEYEINNFSQFINRSLKSNIDIKKIMIVYSYTDSKTDGLLNHTVIME